MKDNTILNREKLSQYLISKQIDVLSNVSGENLLQEIIESVLTLVRAEIMSFPGNILDANPLSIPKIMEATACHLVIEQLHSRIPSLDLTKDQVRNAENARKLLKRVAKGELKIIKQESLSSLFSVINSRKRTFNNNNLKGL